MKKVAIVLVLVAAVAVALFFALRGGGDRPAVAEALSAEQTAGLGGGAQLDALARRWMPIVQLIEPSLDTGKVVATLGFDPTTAEGWTGIGIDPAEGVGLAFDARVRTEGEPIPMAVMRVVDLEKLKTWIGARSQEAVTVEGDGPVRTLVVGDQKALFGERDGWTAVLLADRPSQQQAARAGFEQYIGDSGDTLASAPRYADAFAGAESPLIYAWGGATATGSMLAGFGVPEQVTSTVDFYAALFPASAMWIGEQGGGARLLATEKGVALVRKLFVPQRRPPEAARFVGASGWAAVRVSLNLAQVLDGVGEAMPPAAAQAKSMVGMVRMMLPMAAGVNWDDISAGLSGHAVFAADVMSLAEVDRGGVPQGFAMLGVNDEAKADALIEKLIARGKGQVPGLSVTEIELGGAKGRTIAMGPMQITVLRMDDVILAGTAEAVKAAVARADGEHLDGPLADALDGDGMWAAVADLKPVVAAIEAEMKGDSDARNPFESPAMAPFKEDPRVALTVELDGKGLLWSGRGAVPADIMAVVAGAFMWVSRAGMTGPVEMPAPPPGAIPPGAGPGGVPPGARPNPTGAPPPAPQ